MCLQRNTGSHETEIAPFRMQFNHDVPRSIRVRLNRDRPVRAKHESSTTTIVMSTCTDIIVSPMGREAVGPWSGAFDQAPGSPTSPTVFTNFYGVVFADLEGSPLPAFEEEEETSSTEVRVEEHLESLDRRHRRDGYAPAPGWTQPRSSHPGHQRRRMRGLNQPMRSQH